jgi:hypothetical protein
VTWLVGLPLWAQVLGSLAAFLGVAVGGRAVVRRLLGHDARLRAALVAPPLMPALGAIFGVLVGFTITAEADAFDEVRRDVAAEAGAASRLAWAATAPAVETELVHDALRAYLVRETSAEWSSLRGEHPGDRLSALGRLEATVRGQLDREQVGQVEAAELVDALDDMAVARRDRVVAAGTHVSGVVFGVLVLMGLALVANAVVLTLRESRRVALVVSGLVVVVAASVATVLAVSGPFRGGVVAGDSALVEVLADLEGGSFVVTP